MKRAFIGTGLIGAGLATASIRRDDVVTVTNRTRYKTDPLKALGARVADSPASAVDGASFVHIALTADDAVDGVIGEILGGFPSDAVLIDHSTTSPAGTAARAKRLAGAGIPFLHAPVFMSPTACLNATGVMLAAGPRSAYNVAKDALDRMTGKVWYVGDKVDAAATLKLCGNGMILAMTAALADAHAIALENGLDTAAVTELFQQFNPTNTLKGRGQRMADGDYNTHWSLHMARKDLGLMLDAAGERALQVLPHIGERLDAHIADGEGDRDLGIIGQPGTRS